jgi:hypothetical protein
MIRRFVPRKSFGELVSDPLGRRIGRNADGDQVPACVAQNHQTIEQLEGDSAHHEQIKRGDTGASTGVTTLSDGDAQGNATLHAKLEVPVASLAISVVPARRCVRQGQTSAPNFLARREKIEVTRGGSPLKRSPVPMSRACRRRTRAVCALPRRMRSAATR